MISVRYRREGPQEGDGVTRYDVRGPFLVDIIKLRSEKMHMVCTPQALAHGRGAIRQRKKSDGMTIMDIVNTDPKETIVYEGEMKDKLLAGIREKLCAEDADKIAKASRVVLSPAIFDPAYIDKGTVFGYAAGRTWSYE